MSNASENSSTIGDAERDGTLEKARLRQQASWKAGKGETVEQLVAVFPKLAFDLNALLDLVNREILHRDDNGEMPTLTEYRKRFPSLASKLAKQFPKS